MAGIADADPVEIVAALIRDVDTLREKGQPLDQKELEALRRDLKTAYRLIEEGQSQGAGETAIIANANSSGDRITVAGGGGIRYEVPVERIPSTQRRPGQTVSVMVSNRRALHSSSHFLGDVGTVGRIVRVLQQDGGSPRLQLHEGFIVEASSDVGGLQPRTGDLVRFDPARLVALELICRGGDAATGPIGVVTQVLQGLPARLQLNYGAGESFVVDPTEELLREGIDVGDWVSFDPASRSASRKIARSPEATGAVGEVVDIYTTWHENGQRARRLHVNTGGSEGVLARLSHEIEDEEFTAGDLVVCWACSAVWGCKSPAQPDGGEGLARTQGLPP